tara:strand:+ start:3886 stop:5034 length:1149 start_codon:yes stop_codon:yes gene_type:complete
MKSSSIGESITNLLPENIGLWDIVLAIVIGFLLCSMFSNTSLIEGKKNKTSEEKQKKKEKEAKKEEKAAKKEAKAAKAAKKEAKEAKAAKKEAKEAKKASKDENLRDILFPFCYGPDNCKGKSDDECNSKGCTWIKEDSEPPDPLLKGEAYHIIKQAVEQTSLPDKYEVFKNKHKKIREVDLVGDGLPGNGGDLNTAFNKQNILQYVYKNLNADTKADINGTLDIIPKKYKEKIIDKQTSCQFGWDLLKKHNKALFDNNKGGNIVGINEQEGLYCTNSLFNRLPHPDYKSPKVYIGPFCKDKVGTDSVCAATDVDYSKQIDEKWFQTALRELGVGSGTCSTLTNPCMVNNDNNWCKSYEAKDKAYDTYHYLLDKMPSVGTEC